MEKILLPTTTRWDEKESELSIETVRPDRSSLLKDLSSCKAHGPGEISSYYSGSVQKHLTEMFRNSVEEGLVPRGWKKRNAILVIKKGSM